ncbi:MAG: hypothetical protein HJJLKODD_02994 [Phycisphaerae bacterium]|nr:hypothetical protein [Phycisphaerae bacterium]
MDGYMVFNYQPTTGLCCPVAIINGLVALFGQGIPPVVIKQIYEITLDCRHANGTSSEALQKVVRAINAAARQHPKRFPCKARYLWGRRVTVRMLARVLDCGGVAVPIVLVSRNEHHAITALYADPEWVYVFDGYYRKRYGHLRGCQSANRSGQIVVAEANLRIRREVLECSGHQQYALGPRREREAIILERRSCE